MEIRQMYIDGEWILSSSGEIRDVINPATEEIIAKVTEGTAEDVKKAVASAKRAFYKDGWMEVTAPERAEYLFKIAAKLEENLEKFKVLETINNGKAFRETEADVYDAIGCLKYYAGLINKPNGQVYNVPDPNTQAMVVREPIGVCGQIVPWN